jgi:hypothetical protein
VPGGVSYRGDFLPAGSLPLPPPLRFNVLATSARTKKMYIMEARIYANKAPTSSETARIFLPEMLRTKICTVGDWCYLGT